MDELRINEHFLVDQLHTNSMKCYQFIDRARRIDKSDRVSLEVFL